LNQNYIIPLVPCNILIIKTILVGLYILSVFSIAFFGEKVIKENGWRVGFYSATLTPLLFQEAMKFENDIFGWALIFLSFAVFSLSLNRQNKLIKAICIILATSIAILSTFIWLGSYFGVLYLGLMFFPILVFVIPPFVIYITAVFDYFLKSIFSNQIVSEEMVGAGIIPVMFIFWVLYSSPKKLIYPLATWTSFIIGFIKIKYMLLAIPFLALNFVKFENEHKHLKHWPNLIFVGLAFTCFFNLLSFNAAPTIEQFNTIDSAIMLANDSNMPLYNDWKFGWWLEYKGQTTEYKASFPDPDYNNLTRPFIAISSDNLTNSGCAIYYESNPSIFICSDLND